MVLETNRSCTKSSIINTYSDGVNALISHTKKNAQYDMKLSLYSTLRLGRLSGDIIVSEKIVILAIPAF